MIDSFVEKACSLLHICDAEAEKKIQQAWSAVSRTESHAFLVEHKVP